MIWIILIKFIQNLLVLINIVEKDGVSCGEYKNIKKFENRIVEILAKSKSWNLSKLRFKNLFKFKKLELLVLKKNLTFQLLILRYFLSN